VARLSITAAGLQIDPTYFSSQLGFGGYPGRLWVLSATREKNMTGQSRSLTITGMNSTPDTKRPLEYFWEGQPSEGYKALDALAKEAGKRKEPNAQFEIGIGRAMLCFRFSRTNLSSSKLFSAFLEKATRGNERI